MSRYAASRYTGTRIPEVLRELRKTRRWLAQQMGMTEGGMSSALSGRYRISQQFVTRACAALGRAEDELFFVLSADSTAHTDNILACNACADTIGHSGHRPTSGQADAAGSGAQSGQPTGQEVTVSEPGQSEKNVVNPTCAQHPVSLHSGCSAQC